MRRDSECEVRSPDEPASTARVSRASDTRVAWCAPRRVSRPRVTFNTVPRVARCGFFLARDSSDARLLFLHIYRNIRLKGIQDFFNVHRGGRETNQVHLADKMIGCFFTQSTKKKKRAKESSRKESSSRLSILPTVRSRHGQNGCGGFVFSPLLNAALVSTALVKASYHASLARCHASAAASAAVAFRRSASSFARVRASAKRSDAIAASDVREASHAGKEGSPPCSGYASPSGTRRGASAEKRDTTYSGRDMKNKTTAAVAAATKSTRARVPRHSLP